MTTDQIDDRWIAEHILKYPAEVVGAAWDDTIGTPEVVALIARLVREGKLESEVAGSGAGKSSMTLRLTVDRSTLEGHERTLVDALFFDGRTESRTEDVRSHYSDRGFNPVEPIKSELDARVQLLLESGDSPGPSGLTSILWFLACAAMLAGAWYLGGTDGAIPLFLAIGALAVAGIARIAGVVFRTRMDWGRGAAFLSFLPTMTFAVATATFLWRSVGRSDIDLSLLLVVASVALSLWVTNSSIRVGTSVERLLCACHTRVDRVRRRTIRRCRRRRGVVGCGSWHRGADISATSHVLGLIVRLFVRVQWWRRWRVLRRRWRRRVVIS